MTLEGGNAVKGTGLAGAIARARKKAYPEGYVSSKDPLIDLESKEIIDYLVANGVSEKSNIYVVASQAAQLALGAVQGDVAVRTDSSLTYMHNGGVSGTILDWTVFLSTGGGGGEANTASNVGTTGVGLYYQKSGVDLQFKNLKSSTGKVTVVDSVSDHTVNLGINITTADVSDSADKRYCTDAQKTVIGNTSGTNSGNETTTTIGTLINGAATKSTPIDADQLGLMNSAASNVLTKLSYSDLKTSLNSSLGFVVSNSAISGATKTKITYDTKGLVTSGADATTADIADSTDKRYCTDAQKTVIGNTSGTNSGNETVTTLASLINGATAKSYPEDDDAFGYVDNDSSAILKKITWQNINARLKSYFDTLYCQKNSWANFTPTVTLVGGTGNTVPVYATNSGRYLTVGNICFVQILLDGDGGDEGAGTGQINIALPLTASANILQTCFNLGAYRNSTSYGSLFPTISASGTTVQPRKTSTDFTGADQNNTSRYIKMTFFYEV